MGRVGILEPSTRVELLDGEVVEMAPIGPAHAAGVNCVARAFSRAVGDRAVVAVQNPVVLTNWTEPQPDVTLLRVRSDGYRLSHPTPDDVFLAVEVADTTLFTDRNRKIPLYAAAGVREVWLVDVNAGTIEVLRDPAPEGYRHQQTAARGARVACLAFPDIEVAVTDIVG